MCEFVFSGRLNHAFLNLNSLSQKVSQNRVFNKINFQFFTANGEIKFMGLFFYDNNGSIVTAYDAVRRKFFSKDFLNKNAFEKRFATELEAGKSINVKFGKLNKQTAVITNEGGKKIKIEVS